MEGVSMTPTTTIEVQGETITLSPDQSTALQACLEKLLSESEAVLVGAAGTGKTTVMRAVLSAWKGGVMFLAPTGKAAVRLAEQTGRLTATIHSSIFGTVEESQEEGSRREKLAFGELRTPEGCRSSTLVVVDEASMVNRDLADQLRQAVIGQADAQILWVGDHEQLPPVEGGWGADLTNPTAKLTTVHRQALESPVLELATLIRQRKAGRFSNWGAQVSKLKPATVEQAVQWSEGGEDRVLLTFTNRIRCLANRLLRKRREYPREEVQVGETLLCTFNQHAIGIMNGETFTVAAVEPHEELSEAMEQDIVTVKVEGRSKPFLMAPVTFDAYHPRKSDRAVFREVWKPLYLRGEDHYSFLDRTGWNSAKLQRMRTLVKESAVQGTWGYCLTVHKSQGSQWQEVGFISCPTYKNMDDPDFKRRLSYTAVTRACEGFHAFVLEVVPDYRKRNPYDCAAN
jgi:exodeoxyribonuclease-5